MKKFNVKTLVSLALATFLLGGCASIKTMKKKQDLIGFETKPTVLETHAGMVSVEVEGKIPEKYFAKKANLVATPVVKYNEGEKILEEYAVKMQGEKVKANNLAIIYKEGGNFKVRGSFPYEEAFKMSELQLRMVASKGLAALDFAPVKLADGIIATSELVDKKGAPIIAIKKGENKTGKYDPSIDPFQRIVPDEMIADLHYLINSSFIRKEETSAVDMTGFKDYAIDAVKNDRKELKTLEVSAYASPDGSLELNEKLSKEREGSASKFFTDEMKKAEITAALKTRYTAEDWEGFKELVSKSNIQDKELIIRVLTMYTDPEVREKEIRNLSQAFTAVADQILPALRRAKFIANVDLIGRTDEEILTAAANDPKSLNQAELIYALTLTDDLAKQLQFATAFTKQFEDDWRGYNNLGMVYAKQGEFEKAAPNFEKADKLNPKSPIVQNNLGTIALYNGDLKKAMELFAAASGLGKQVDYNMGIVSIKRAEYDKAVKYFGDCTRPNAALAKILAGDNNGALKVLEADESGCAMTSYLKAVVGARTAKENLVLESLSAAVAKDSKMKAAAKTDLEFAKYFDNPKFKEIVQ